MSALLAITAVSTSLETLTTGSAHGLLTGDRFRLFNVGGALPAATPSLATSTTYFAIKVDNTTIKISDTNAHALAGTNIFDLTGSGSGTTYIGIGLPFCERRVSAAGSQVFSIDDNEAWASIVGGQRGPRVRHIPASSGIQTGGAAMSWSGLYDTIFTTSTTNVFRIPIQLDQGERLLNVQCRVLDPDASNSVSMAIYRSDLSGTANARLQLGTTQTSTGSANQCETLTVSGLTELVGSQFYSYFAEFTVPTFLTAGCQIGPLFVTTDVP